MDFVTISVKCSPECTAILIPTLFEIGFDSFQEFDDGFEGSSEKEAFSEDRLTSALHDFPDVSLVIKDQEKINWNEKWEKNYDPIIVDNKCLVRAAFHDTRENMDYEIVINPKMSFGTGHHATTYQMLSYQMKLDHAGKKVLDVGCGTGILSIMAGLRGAKEIVATDIDDWCIENSLENFSLNDFKSIQLIKGQIGELEQTEFDIVIVNIDKNILMDQLKTYTDKLKVNGKLLLSGFYQQDVKELEEEGMKYGMIKLVETTRDNWIMLVMEKEA